MDIDKSNEPHCNYNNFRRARYFPGMLLTEQDLKIEQEYHIAKRKWLNKMLHGWGVVCGLEVEATNPPSKNIIIKPGTALDCHGNEIIVCEEQKIDLFSNFCTSTSKELKDPCSDFEIGKKDITTLYVVIRYQENKSNPVPIYAPGTSCGDKTDGKTCDYSRIHEGFCIEVRDSLPAQPPIKTIESDEFSGERCKKPFPCPNPYQCADPHYILLATISCGERIDFLSKKVFKKDDSGSVKAEIYYRVKRTMDKVCILTGDSTTGEYIIEITDHYQFYTKDEISNINWFYDDVNKSEGIEIVGKVTPKEGDRNYILKYVIKAAAQPPPRVEFYLPVSLKYEKEKEKITWTEEELPLLESPIEIGLSDVKCGGIISKAMIRNVDMRKFVPSFHWLAWLRGNMEEDEFSWSGYVNSCKTSAQITALEDTVEELKNKIDYMYKQINMVQGKKQKK